MRVCQVQRRGESSMDSFEGVIDIRYEVGWLHVIHAISDGGEVWTTSYPTSFIGEVRVFEDNE